MPSVYLAGARIVAEADRFATYSMGAAYEGTVSLDPLKSPCTFAVWSRSEK